MGNNICKDPNFPMQHLRITELKNTTKIIEMVQQSDLLITRNGETVAYLLTPEHYEALIARAQGTCASATETFLKNYQRRQGNIHRLAEEVTTSMQGKRATISSKNEIVTNL